MTEYYAHSLAGELPEHWEMVETHLRLVAEGDEGFQGAAGFAEAFGAAEYGRLLGLWHDLGKYSQEFRAYLYRENGLEASLETLPGKVDHSTAGAQHAVRQFGNELGRLLAYCIAGHHGGLPDAEASQSTGTSLRQRLAKQVPSTSAAPSALLERPAPTMPRLNLGAREQEAAFRLSVFCRMIFSCLVDADFLATERFMRPDKSAERRHEPPALAELQPVLDTHLDELQHQAPVTPVNCWRQAVLEACRQAADEPPGLFSLTVPTGGGKTLSSMAFALRHAVQHDMRRVIYAIPFTSIIEQNAEVFRKALSAAGPDVVLEHHCNMDPDQETRFGRLSAENWDAPIVVTTNVQFYESLFANKPSRCRKLHRIARSIIVLDEAQSLPVELLRPTLAMLEELCRNYGCTVVLCTATQPAVTHREDFSIGLRGVREIVADVPQLFAALRRVEVVQESELKDDALIERLLQKENERSLCIVNTRKHAACLFEMLNEKGSDGHDGFFHLSAQMCPAHRTDVLNKIRTRLDAQSPQPCRVISTQLIEAGVDIDFPVVFRAMAGLDSILQAAGRCNREGKLDRGRLYLLETEGGTFPEVHRAAQATREVARTHADLTSLEAINAFFKLHFWQRKAEWDKRKIMQAFSLSNVGLHAQFRKVAGEYKLIRDEQVGVIVPYGKKSQQLITALKNMRDPPGRGFARGLQAYSVGLRDRQLRKLIENAAVTQYHDQYWVVENEHAYDQNLGLRLEVVGLNPESLMI